MLYTGITLFCALLMTSCLDQRSIDPNRGGRYQEPWKEPNSPSGETFSQLIEEEFPDLKKFDAQAGNMHWPSGRDHDGYTERKVIKSVAELKAAARTPNSALSISSPLLITEPITFSGPIYVYGAKLRFEGPGAIVLALNAPPAPGDGGSYCGGLTTGNGIKNSVVFVNDIDGEPTVKFENADSHLSFPATDRTLPDGSRRVINLKVDNSASENLLVFGNRLAKVRWIGTEVPYVVLQYGAEIEVNWGTLASTPERSRKILSLERYASTRDSSGDHLSSCLGESGMIWELISLVQNDPEAQKNPKSSARVKELFRQQRLCLDTDRWSEKITKWPFCGSL